MSAEPARGPSGEVPTSVPALLLYGEEHTNLALADEMSLDGYEVHRASDPAMMRAACDTREIALVIFGRATDRGAGLDMLRRLRAGKFTPEANPRLRALRMSPNGELGDVLRGFQAGADDVIRTPFAYPEFRARVQALTCRDLIETPGVIETGSFGSTPPRTRSASERPRRRLASVGVRAARASCERPCPRLHQGRATAGGVGHRLGHRDEDAGLARLAAALQARPRRRRRMGGRHSRCRLPPLP